MPRQRGSGATRRPGRGGPVEDSPRHGPAAGAGALDRLWRVCGATSAQGLVSEPPCPTCRSESTVKFRVEREVLADAVTWGARGLPARPPVPVLAGVLLEASDEGTLTLSAFDYEVSAKITVAADVSEGGTVLVLGRLLADISRNLPGKPVDVSTDGNKVSVTCGSSRFSLMQMPADDYPTLPTAPAPSGTVAGDVFPEAVDASHVALIPARTLSDTAKALGASGTVEIALGSSAGGEGLVGFEAGQ